MKIAIVGTGISGLVAARRLYRNHDITLFEAASRVGGHTNTIDVEVGGRDYAIDTGFIVYNESNYPHFTQLLGELDVASQTTSMSFSVRCESIDLEYKGEAKADGRGVSWPGLFAQPRNALRPRFWRLLRDILKFRRVAPAALDLHDEQCSVAEFARDNGLSDAFVDLYLVPLGASLWSCPPRTFRGFPMRFVSEFLANHAMLDIGQRPVWRVVRGGSREYIAPLTAPFRDRIRTSARVERIVRGNDGILVATQDTCERFDHVILASHADTSRALVENPFPIEQEVLAAFPYQSNVAILHTDHSVLPRRRQAWASWNYRADEPASDTGTVTYNMNVLQGIDSDTTFCVTLNDEHRIDTSKIVQRIPYDHPVFTVGRQRAQSHREDLIDLDGISYCGAYWGYGFHEDGVRSALEVANRIDQRLSTNKTKSVDPGEQCPAPS